MNSRNRSIDALRGLSIVLMIFFTTTLILSKDLPYILRHNARNSIHLGDFVLPLFLFSSGMSLSYYFNKHKDEDRITYFWGLGRRFIRLGIVAILLSPYSSRGFLEMDEIMLSALCFLGCVILAKVDWRLLLGTIFVINTSYMVLIHNDWTDHFREYYLGGYLAALYYFPVMLSGVMIGDGMRKEEFLGTRNVRIICFIFIMFVYSMTFVDMRKMAATPPFMMASILLCFGSYGLIDILDKKVGSWGELEFLGKKPFRYWIMMYVVMIVPLKVMEDNSSLHLPLDLPWGVAILISGALLVCLWLLSKLFDKYFSFRGIVFK